MKHSNIRFLKQLSIRFRDRNSFKRSVIFAHEWAPHYNTHINLRVTTNIGKEYIVLYEAVTGPFFRHYTKADFLSPIDHYEVFTRLCDILTHMERFGERIIDIKEL